MTDLPLNETALKASWLACGREGVYGDIEHDRKVVSAYLREAGFEVEKQERRPQMPELTEPQMRALREVGAERVRWSARDDRYFSTTFPPAVRDDVVRRLLKLQLVEIGSRERPWRMLMTYRMTLTVRGREALTDVR